MGNINHKYIKEWLDKNKDDLYPEDEIVKKRDSILSSLRKKSNSQIINDKRKNDAKLWAEYHLDIKINK